ncbi:hypothetical protein QE152_g8827 [Popillia japonica]|uniref:Uncharacterized protein n=1 Tax=Popillia japonica TaxID=7064 RepID=A0AAW1M0F2_POPJA
MKMLEIVAFHLCSESALRCDVVAPETRSQTRGVAGNRSSPARRRREDPRAGTGSGEASGTPPRSRTTRAARRRTSTTHVYDAEGVSPGTTQGTTQAPQHSDVTEREQNRLYYANQRQFYKSIQNTDHQSDRRCPDVESITNFWSGIWSSPKIHQEGKWKREEDKTIRNIRTMEHAVITNQDVQEALRKTQNWKSPGIDSIHNFWYLKKDPKLEIPWY